jgi:hypothetical protein
MDLEEVGWNSVDLLYLAPDRNQWRVLVNMILKLSSRTTISVSGRSMSRRINLLISCLKCSLHYDNLPIQACL